MKKPFCLFLCLLLAAVMSFSAIACGSEKPAQSQQAAEAAVPAQAEESDNTEAAAASTPEPTEEPTAEPTATPSPEPTPEPTPEPLIRETVVVDNIAGVTVTAKKLEETEGGYELTLEAQNKSDGFYLNLIPRAIRVNGYLLNLIEEDGYIRALCLCDAGRNKTDSFLIPRYELDLLGIESIDSLSVAFEIRMHKSGSDDEIDEYADEVNLIKSGEEGAYQTPGTVFYSDGTVLLSALALNEKKNGVYLYYELSGPEGFARFMHQYDNRFDSYYTVNGQKTECSPYLMEGAFSMPAHGLFVFYASDAQLTEPVADLSFSLLVDLYGPNINDEIKVPTVEMSFDENGIAVLDPAYVVDATAAVSAEESAVTDTPKNGAIAITGSEPFENEKLKISITDVQAFNGDLVLTMKAENKSDETIELSSDLCLANGYQVTAMMSRSDFSSGPLEPGTETEYFIYLFYLDNYNMSAGSVSEIRISFLYGAPGAWLSDRIQTDPITATLDQEPAEPLDLAGYSVLYDANDVKIVYLLRSEAGTGLLFYVENNTDQEMSMTADSKMKIDGYGTSDWPVSVAPGVKRVVEYGYYDKDGSLLSIDWKIQEATVGFQLVIKGKKYQTATLTETLED